jgi:hypothetical protein
MLLHEQTSLERGSMGFAAEIAAGWLEIVVEAGGSEVGGIVERHVDRDFTGKAVLHIRRSTAW